jgi:outer membrane protein OmpA-like peptidoglycan-associated protein
LQCPGPRFLLQNFTIGKADLKQKHQGFLKQVYFGTLTSDPMARIEIVGHADSTGSKGFNEKLARKRARETEKALRGLGRHNLRIATVTGKGAKDPMADNGSVFGRAQNRRVEILVTPGSRPSPSRRS